MDIRRKIQELSDSTAHNSITPQSLGAILMAMYEATIEGDKVNANIINETKQIAGTASQNIEQLSKVVNETGAVVGKLSETVGKQENNATQMGNALTSVKSEMEKMSSQVVDMQTTVKEVQTNVQRLSAEYTIVMADNDGKLQEKKIGCVWKGPKESYEKLCRQGLRDSNTAYIISE